MYSFKLLYCRLPLLLLLLLLLLCREPGSQVGGVGCFRSGSDCSGQTFKTIYWTFQELSKFVKGKRVDQTTLYAAAQTAPQSVQGSLSAGMLMGLAS